jgi:hypothetical protein
LPQKNRRRNTEERPASGITGLDDVLSGGFARGRTFLLEGNPGTGKTTIALQFLMAGARVGERGLYVTMSETEGELRSAADSHGWNLAGIEVFAPEKQLADEQQQCRLVYSGTFSVATLSRRFSIISVNALNCSESIWHGTAWSSDWYALVICRQDQPLCFLDQPRGKGMAEGVGDALVVHSNRRGDEGHSITHGFRLH